MHLLLPVPNITIGDAKSEVGFGTKTPVLLGHSFETVLQELSVEEDPEQPAEESRTEKSVKDEDDGPELEPTSDASEMDEFELLEEEPNASITGHSEQLSQRGENVTPSDDALYSKSIAPTNPSEARPPEATPTLLHRLADQGSGNHPGLVESVVSKPSAAASSGAPFLLNHLKTGLFISRSPDATLASPPISPSRVAEPVAQDRREAAVLQSHISASLIASGYDRGPESNGGKIFAPEGLETQGLSASRPFQSGIEATSGRDLKEIPAKPQAAGTPARASEVANVGFPPAAFSGDTRQGDANPSTSPLPGDHQLEGESASVSTPLTAAKQRAEQSVPPGENANLRLSNAGAGSLTPTEAQRGAENKDARPVEASALHSARRMDAHTDHVSLEVGRNASVQMPVAHREDTATNDVPSTPARQAGSPRERVPEASTAETGPASSASSYPVANASSQDSAFVLPETGSATEMGIEDADGVGQVAGIEAFSTSSSLPLAKQALPQVPGIGRQVLQQLVDVPLHPNERIEITLAPEELGRIRLSATQSDQGVVLLVQAERPETLDLMRRHLPDLLQDLQALGFSDVGYSDQQNQGQQQEQASQSEASVDVSPPDIAQQTQPASGLDLRL